MWDDRPSLDEIHLSGVKHTWSTLHIFGTCMGFIYEVFCIPPIYSKHVMRQSVMQITSWFQYTPDKLHQSVILGHVYFSHLLIFSSLLIHPFHSRCPSYPASSGRRPSDGCHFQGPQTALWCQSTEGFLSLSLPPLQSQQVLANSLLLQKWSSKGTMPTLTAKKLQTWFGIYWSTSCGHTCPQ